MSGSSNHSSQTPPIQQGEPSSSRPSSSRPPRPNSPPVRYVGDGLDFRRPVMSSNQPEEPVIDLTNEPDSSPQNTRRPRTPSGTAPRSRRGPRFSRDILSEPDVVDLVDEPDSAAGNQDPPTSPEVQFVRANSRPHPGPRLPPLSRNGFFDMVRRSAEIWPTHFLPFDVETIWFGEGAGHGFDMAFNVDVQGLGPEPGPAHAPPRDTYKPPSPPPEGFTRSAGEDELVICPNCEMELGTGGELKQQIWVAKPCGHVCLQPCISLFPRLTDQVYCGECTKNRALSKSKKGPQRTRPFAKCQVPDCGKTVSSPKSMIQIYL